MRGEILVEKIEITTKKQCESLRNNSALTWEGLSADDESLNQLKDWINRYTKLLNERVYIIHGKQMNKWYKLTGNNAYPDDLTIVSIDLQDIESVQAIVIPRFEVGGRWLDDIIDNNIRRENA